MLKELCYVVDLNNQPLSPTNFNKGWYLVRKNKATLVSSLPFIIKLCRAIKNINDNSKRLFKPCFLNYISGRAAF